MRNKSLLLFLMSLIPIFGSGQTTSDTPGFVETYLMEIVLGLVFVVFVLVLLVLIVLLKVIQVFVYGKKTQEEDEEHASQPTLWSDIMRRLTNAVPLTQESQVVTDHEYDGIRELDNKLPPWWVGMFWITIIFAVIYLLHFEVFQTGMSSKEAYIAEMKLADEQIKAYQATLTNLIDESNVELSDASGVATGKEIYMGKCVACHGAEGQGGVGPNLTDIYWLHGGDIKDIFKTVKYGVPAKGMISWAKQLTPLQMQQVSSYIYSLEGTNPPNPKKPQGKEFIRESDSSSTEELEDGDKEKLVSLK